MNFSEKNVLRFLIGMSVLLVCPVMAQGAGGEVMTNQKDMVVITVSDGLKPTFSWSKDVKIGKLVVENEQGVEVWGTETEGENVYQSPIEYSVNPPQAVEPEPGRKLTADHKYNVMLYRWISQEPEEFQLVGRQEFTPSATAENEFTRFEKFDPKNFDNPTNIDNPWDPLKPGTKYVYEGYTTEGGETTPHRVVFIVTDLTKVIAGVRTLVIYDRDFSDNVLEEAELTFFAQDNEGNVWHFGQYRETYDDIEFVGGRVWREGYPPGSKAGIMMQANPTMGAPSYSQGFAPAPFNWTDRARIYKTGEKTSVPVGDFDDVMIIEEYNAEEPGAFQLKYYATGVGNIRVGWRGDDQQQENMELVEKVVLKPDELAQIRNEALELEKRAYLYCDTPPAEQMAPVKQEKK